MNGILKKEKASLFQMDNTTLKNKNHLMVEKQFRQQLL